MPKDWSGEGKTWRIDSNVSHSGKSSLRFFCQDANRYDLCSQALSLQGGRKYDFSMWGRTRGIVGAESGATICLEWYDANDAWMGGGYPEGVKGDTDWTLVRGTARVPQEARSFRLQCYVRRGMTGEAWFDDVDIHRICDPLLQSFLLQPGYRGRLREEPNQELRTRAMVNLADLDTRSDSLAIAASVSRADDANRHNGTSECRVGPDGNADLAIWATELAAKEYEVEIRLINTSSGAVLATQRHRVRRMGGDFHPRVTVDAHRRVLIEGKPFFPLGMYCNDLDEEVVKAFAGSPFNCLMPYDSPTLAQMDRAHEEGLWIIYSIKDWYAGTQFCPAFIRKPQDEEAAVRKRIGEFRNHPALLAWYLNDELPTTCLPRLQSHQQWLEQEDANHPSWVVLYQVNELRDYLGTFDVIGTDPYPINRQPASLAAQWARITVQTFGSGRPAWMVPQVFNWAVYEKDPAARKRLRTPTQEEIRSMAWQCICEGATGLIFYSFSDLKRNPDVPYDQQWSRCKAVAKEISDLSGVLLSVQPPPAIKASGGPWLHWTSRCLGERLYLFAVNDGDGEGKMEVELPKNIQSLYVQGEPKPLPVIDGRASFSMKKLDVAILEADLPK